ncbi:two-component system response regulator [Amphritea sp. HPY]|uniref:two-component system response regulator n=1 Tax=Amphritea sp. HPY TaxID=3421652 RepID=UPI003D7DC0AC
MKSTNKHNGQIVIVDDQAINLRLLSEILSEEGYKVRSTIDGEQALVSIGLCRPDLILLDIKMPGIDGYEVCRRLKATPEVRDIPVIFISALNTSEDRLKGFELGGVDFISKPFQRQEVVSRIHTHITLYQTQRELTVQKADLEDRVRERTAELLDANQALKGAQRIASLGNWEWNFATDQVSWSDEMYRILNQDPQRTVPGNNAYIDSTHPEDQNRLRQTIVESRDNLQPFSIEHRILQIDGSIRYLHTLGEIVVDKSHQATHMCGTIQDITEQRQTQEKLEQANTVFESTAEGIIITDAKQHIISVNPAFSEITGFKRHEAIGQNLDFRHSIQHKPSFYQTINQALLKEGLWRGEMWNTCKDKTVNPELVAITAIRNPQGELTNYIMVLSDISSLKKSEEQLEYLAHHDPLTDLANRLLLNDRLEHGIATAARQNNSLALLFIDLDRFKDINDSFGHTFGDSILKLVASRLKNELRTTDTVARLGGDEFIILAENIQDQSEIITLSQKILSIFIEPFAPNNNEIFVGASIGISVYPDDGDCAATLIRNADTAMYQAKNAGRNTFRFYTSELTAAATDRLQMETALRRAITNNELSLHFQPIVDPSSGKTEHLEALLRWHNKELGNVTPDRFIPLAEATSLIIPIGEWVLRNACQEMQKLLQLGYPLNKVSVNISSLQIQRCDLPKLVAEILQETGLNPHHLDLEITESVLMDEPEKVLLALNQIRSLGVTLTIDDFGTGYSSLSYLKRFPINTVKIDQSFVRDIPHDPNDEAIARAIIALAQSLQLGIVAEGVETDAQRSFLIKENCERAQGFYYSRPLPPERLIDYLDAKQKTENEIQPCTQQ